MHSAATTEKNGGGGKQKQSRRTDDESNDLMPDDKESNDARLVCLCPRNVDSDEQRLAVFDHAIQPPGDAGAQNAGSILHFPPLVSFCVIIGLGIGGMF